MGLAAGLVCYAGVLMKNKLGYDDALDVVGVHGVGGAVGALLTGVFATTVVNSAGANGLMYGGGFALLSKQAVSVLSVAAFSGIGTFVCMKVAGALVGCRVEREAELEGLDPHLHGEHGYSTAAALGSEVIPEAKTPGGVGVPAPASAQS
jgi:Amt family ammonium transporter